MLRSLCTADSKTLISIVSCVMLLTFRSSVSLNISEVVTATLAVTPEVTLAVTKVVKIVTMTLKLAMKSDKLLKITALKTTPGTSRIGFYLISRTCVS